MAKIGMFALDAPASAALTRQDFVERILVERERQLNLPGSELDLKNGPNDWAAIITHYVNLEVHRGGRRPDREEYEIAMIKAAAVILAALENMDTMNRNGRLG